MNLLETFASGDLIVAISPYNSCNNELWTIVEGETIKLIGQREQGLPRNRPAVRLDDGWAYKKIMSFYDFTDIIEGIKS